MLFYKAKDENIKLYIYYIVISLSESEDILIIEELIKSQLVADMMYEYNLSTDTILPCVRIIGNLASNLNAYVEYLMKLKVLNFFKIVFSINNNIIIKEALWAFSNFTASSRSINKEILEDQDIVEFLKKLIYVNDFQVKLEVLYTLGNILNSADYEILKKLLKYKLDEDILLTLKETKNPELIKILCGIIDCLIDLPLYKDNYHQSNGKNEIIFQSFNLEF